MIKVEIGDWVSDWFGAVIWVWNEARVRDRIIGYWTLRSQNTLNP